MIAFNSWSPSRLEKWETCPRKARYVLLDKLCPACFKGTLEGKWGQPQICNKCKAVEEVGAPLARGDDIGNRLDAYLTGKAKLIPVEIRHPLVQDLARTVKKQLVKGRASVQEWVKLDANWKKIPDKQFGPAWFNGRLDAKIRKYGDKVVQVIDWKTGGLDKKTGEVSLKWGKEKAYEDQCKAYQATLLAAFPEVSEVEALLAFTDTDPKFDPFVRFPNLKRDDFPAARKEWEKRLKPYFADRTFAPRANDGCRFCPFARGKGGPCPY